MSRFQLPAGHGAAGAISLLLRCSDGCTRCHPARRRSRLCSPLWSHLCPTAGESGAGGSPGFPGAGKARVPQPALPAGRRAGRGLAEARDPRQRCWQEPPLSPARCPQPGDIPAGGSWRLPWERHAGVQPPLPPALRRVTLFFVKRHTVEEMQPLFVPAI